MNKFRELIFLKSLKRVGKAAIYGKFWDILNDAEDFDELYSRIDKPQNELEQAKRISQDLYDFVRGSPEITVITVFDDDYPQQLMLMGNKRPLFLFVKGNADALFKPNIAFIGTRKPIKDSEEFEQEAVKSILKYSERVIVSGLALGCDKIAHQTTVDENGATIAILPSGINVITPASNKKLAEEIIATGGCLVSEYLPDAKAFKGTYVERDKIVAAFSDATFVVECGIKSGTMHTVNAAFDYGKTVFSYLPENRAEGSYDGNEFILNSNGNSIKVDSISDFLQDLDNLNQSVQSIKSESKQQKLI